MKIFLNTNFSCLAPVTKSLKGARLYCSLLHIVREALEAFINGDLHKFDGTIGNNACETQAVIMCTLFNNAVLRDQCEEVLKLVDVDIIQLERCNLKKPLQEVTEFLDNPVLPSEEIQVLFHFFVLFISNLADRRTIVNEEGKVEYIVRNDSSNKCIVPLKKEYGLSSSEALQLRYNARVFCSKYVILFIKWSLETIPSHLQDEQYFDILSALSNEEIIRNVDPLIPILSMPCYLRMVASMLIAKANHLYIELRLQKFSAEERVVIDNGTNVLFFDSEFQIADDLPVDQAYMLLTAYYTGHDSLSENVERIKSCGIDKILAACGADHSQYTGQVNRDAHFILNEQQVKMKKFAIAGGVSRSNPWMCAPRHFRAEVVKKSTA
jgi:hypothetical protein